MRTLPIALAVATSCLAACGSGPGSHAGADASPGHDAPAADAAPGTLLSRLQALPGVTAQQVTSSTPGYDAYLLEFTQPVDHADPTGPTFQQEATLIVVAAGDLTRPFVIETTGYFDFAGSIALEPTEMLQANQISIEHRFFGTSRPSPADWSKATIEQMADDTHAIVTLLKPLFTGAYISTGQSKGGMTALFDRRYFPDDVAGTVAYVSPISFGSADTRYDAQFDTIGPADGSCRQAIKDVAAEMLHDRRDAMTTRAQAEATANNFTYTRVPLGPSVEAAIESLEWAFWQYNGVQDCDSVPSVTDSDDQLFAFLDNVSPVSSTDDDSCAQFETYYFQAGFQLGQPDPTVPYLTAFEQYTGSDFAGLLPADAPTPVYDGGAAMDDMQTWVSTQGSQLILVYGEWDPWTGGAWSLGSATDSQLSVQAAGTHGSDITHLAVADRDNAIAKLQSWTGVPLDRAPELAHAGRLTLPRAPRAVHRAPVIQSP
jgi:hypothetical protein|nr:S28 family serine protease [Kofleriaceae bacterium]